MKAILHRLQPEFDDVQQIFLLLTSWQCVVISRVFLLCLCGVAFRGISGWPKRLAATRANRGTGWFGSAATRGVKGRGWPWIFVALIHERHLRFLHLIHLITSLERQDIAARIEEPRKFVFTQNHMREAI